MFDFILKSCYGLGRTSSVAFCNITAKRRRKVSKPFWKIFLHRVIVAVILVMITYNIWGISYYHWVTGSAFEGLETGLGAVKVVTGILLAVAYIALLWATIRSLKAVGVLLMLIVLGGFIYVIWAFGLISFSNADTNRIIGQIITALSLAIGSTWSIFWKIRTGQYSVEDPDTD